jgi:hypothetical protein
MNENEAVEEERTPGLVLVGFGGNRLEDMLHWIGTDKEDDLLSAFTKWPPVYREERICDQKDLKYACQFLAFVQDRILQYELETPEGDEENNDGALCPETHE